MDDPLNTTAARQADANPLKRVAHAEDIAESILFLAGPGARHISGELLMADSGLHLQMTGAKG